MLRPNLNPKAVEQYLRFSYPVAGSVLAGIESPSYPQIRFDIVGGRTKDECLEKLLEILGRLFEEERRCCDAAFLSSGVDSSLLAFGIQAKKTFSVAYDDEEFNESDLAIQAAKELGSEHHVVTIGPSEYLDAVQEAMASRTTPTGDASYVALYLAAKEAARYTDVVCSGEGPDELFCGYPCYNQYFENPSEDYWLHVNTIMDVGQIPALPSYGGDGFLRMNAFDLSIWMQNNILPNVVAAANGAGITIRTPYVQKDLWDFALALPYDLKANKSMGKLLFREAALRYVGPEIAFREKRGFPVPIRKWMRTTDYKAQIWDALTSPLACEALACVDAERLLLSFYDDKDDGAWKQIWEMFALIRWLETLDGEGYENNPIL